MSGWPRSTATAVPQLDPAGLRQSIPFRPAVAQYLAGGWNANVAAPSTAGDDGHGIRFRGHPRVGRRHEELLDESVDRGAPRRPGLRDRGVDLPGDPVRRLRQRAAAMIATSSWPLYVFDRTGPVTPSSDRAA